MSFDKVKTMRNAERFLAQGKIRAAIGEYQQIIKNDPKDFSTLNILGDLFVKDSDQKQAIDCYRRVAEHYGKQGFAQKAIAVYNKISRLQPGSIEISAKLAELYKMKGSFVEARAHFLAVAEHYQQQGKKTEALAIWKQIAELDPNNTDIYLTIAEACQEEEQFEDAVKAFIESGQRLAKHERHEAAVDSFSKALKINSGDMLAIQGLVKSQISLGYSDEAAKTLEDLNEKQPNNKDVIYLLADCYMDLNKPQEAEKAIVRLVEREPANYTKLLELIDVYLKDNDLSSATRILSMTVEQLLVGGQAEDLLKWLTEILLRNPEQLDALRLLVRYRSWERDEPQLKAALEKLAETARMNDAVDEEKYALSQLVRIAPQEEAFSERLREISPEHNFADYEPVIENTFELETEQEDVPAFENFAILDDEEENLQSVTSFEAFENFYSEESDLPAYTVAEVGLNGSNGHSVEAKIIEEVFPENAFEIVEEEDEDFSDLKPADEFKLRQELESVEFYFAQGYNELAEKSLDALEEEYGKRADITELREKLKNKLPLVPAKIEAGTEDEVEIFQAAAVVEQEVQTSKIPPFQEASPKAESSNPFEDFKSGLGLEESESQDNSDYETHYQMAIAYKEMGLMEDAIKEFQDAINLSGISDGTRRFFQCANLLGHCFMEKQMPNLASMWYKRALETPDLNDDERQALLFELGVAYEAGGDKQKAVEYFELVYAVDVDYRNVGERLQNLHS